MVIVRCAECGLTCATEALCPDCMGAERYSSDDEIAAGTARARGASGAPTNSIASAGEKLTVRTDDWVPTEFDRQSGMSPARGGPVPESSGAAGARLPRRRADAVRLESPPPPPPDAISTRGEAQAPARSPVPVPAKAPEPFEFGWLALFAPIVIPALYFGVKGCETAVAVSRARAQTLIETAVYGFGGFVRGFIHGALVGVEWMLEIVRDLLEGSVGVIGWVAMTLG